MSKASRKHHKQDHRHEVIDARFAKRRTAETNVRMAVSQPPLSEDTQKIKAETTAAETKTAEGQRTAVVTKREVQYPPVPPLPLEEIKKVQTLLGNLVGGSGFDTEAETAISAFLERLSARIDYHTSYPDTISEENLALLKCQNQEIARFVLRKKEEKMALTPVASVEPVALVESAAPVMTGAPASPAATPRELPEITEECDDGRLEATNPSTLITREPELAARISKSEIDEFTGIYEKTGGKRILDEEQNAQMNRFYRRVKARLDDQISSPQRDPLEIDHLLSLERSVKTIILTCGRPCPSIPLSREEIGWFEEFYTKRSGRSILSREDELLTFRFYRRLVSRLTLLEEEAKDAGTEGKTSKEAKEIVALQRLRTSIKNFICEKYKGMIITIANNIRKSLPGALVFPLKTEDLVHYGMVEMLRKTIDSYDPEKGTRLSTYMYSTLSTGIWTGVCDECALGMSINIFMWYMRVKTFIKKQKEETEKEPGPKDIATKLKMPESTVNDILSIASRVDPYKYHDDPERNVMGKKADKGPDQLQALIRKEMEGSLMRIMEKMLSGLDPQEREVITRRYGLGDSNEEDTAEIGKSMGINRWKVTKIEERAIKKIKERAEELGFKELEDFEAA